MTMAATREQLFTYRARATGRAGRPALKLVSTPEEAPAASDDAGATPRSEERGPQGLLQLPVPSTRDDGWAAELYRCHGALVYRRCLRMLGNREDARDATQEVFLRLVRDRSLLADRANFLPWLYCVATNHCLNLRRASRAHPADELEEARPVAPRAGGDLVDGLLAGWLLAHFDHVTQRIAVGVLVEGMEHKELAEALGLSRRSLVRRLERFLGEARRLLKS
jgi:RNA polymerase sigma-70 factor (ECF subfamily)